MKTVLIADDNPAGRDLLRTVLDSCGYLVLEAADYNEALRHTRQSHPDLIILQMPYIDGFGVTKELRGEVEFASTPIIALTASAMEGDRGRAISAGFTGYLTKPIRLSDLRGEVELLLR